MKVALSIDSLYVYYDEVKALDNISLKVKMKDFLAIIGPNGGGKSTLLKSILGILKPSKGKIQIHNKPLEQARGLIGYVPQFSKFHKNFPISVEEVIRMGLLKNNHSWFIKYTKDEMKKSNQIMEKLDLMDLSKRQIGQLSGGQLQRVLIARALCVEPKVLLLDEPTASLDASGKNQIYELLKDLNQDMTIIMVTHDMDAISSYVKSIACLNQKLFYHGSPHLSQEVLGKVYGCPIDLLAHGMPHRVFGPHKGDGK